jgi:sulfotransferase family protein
MIAETKPQPTFSGMQRRFVHRALDRSARVMQRLGLPDPDLSEASVMRAAERRTGLSDWGDDEGFRVPLGLVLEHAASEPRFGYLARLCVRQKYIHLCANRLLIQDELRRHPEIADLPITRPLFVSGLPRTGTTLVYNLLAQDPAARPLMTWESFVRPAISAEDERRGTDPRQREARWLVRMLDYLVPQLRMMHAVDPAGPEECVGLLENAFIFLFQSHAPTYQQWLRDLSHEQLVAGYRYYRLQLQILQRQSPAARWILKCPVHLFALDALAEVFPDACIVQTHREPLEVVPSGCSLLVSLMAILFDRIDLKHATDFFLDTTLACLDRSMQARESIDPARFFDLHFNRLMEDPIGSVRQIYKHFDFELSPEIEQRMERALRERPRHKHGVHRYSLAQFGLDADEVERLFEPYCRRFQIRPEQPSDRRNTPASKQPTATAGS